MTFVLNLLHQDFSLLAADRRAVSKEPSTFSIGTMTIHVKGQTRINGFRKVLLNLDGTLAVGFAGTISAHDYREQVRTATGLKEALGILNESGAVLPSATREDFLRGSVPSNEWIATYFDPQQEVFFSYLRLFDDVQNLCRKLMQLGDRVHLVTAGSGGNAFESCVGRAEIERFATSVRLPRDKGMCLEWLAGSFEKVSKVDAACGGEFDAFMATRENPRFEKIT